MSLERFSKSKIYYVLICLAHDSWLDIKKSTFHKVSKHVLISWNSKHLYFSCLLLFYCNFFVHFFFLVVISYFSLSSPVLVVYKHTPIILLEALVSWLSSIQITSILQTVTQNYHSTWLRHAKRQRCCCLSSLCTKDANFITSQQNAHDQHDSSSSTCLYFFQSMCLASKLHIIMSP